MDEVEQFRSGHVVIGVDTHKHIHVAAVMDSIGGTLATLTIATDTAGFRAAPSLGCRVWEDYRVRDRGNGAHTVQD